MSNPIEGILISAAVKVMGEYGQKFKKIEDPHDPADPNYLVIPGEGTIRVTGSLGKEHREALYIILSGADLVLPYAADSMIAGSVNGMRGRLDEATKGLLDAGKAALLNASQEIKKLQDTVGKLEHRLQEATDSGNEWHGLYEQSQREVKRLQKLYEETLQTKREWEEMYRQERTRATNAEQELDRVVRSKPEANLDDTP